MCAKACQYNAIQNYSRPCEVACKVKAISMDEDHSAKINDESFDSSVAATMMGSIREGQRKMGGQKLSFSNTLQKELMAQAGEL